jgi:hypothetical protein
MADGLLLVAGFVTCATCEQHGNRDQQRETEMANCPDCLQQIPEISEGKFCPFCGAALATASAPDSFVSAPVAAATSEPRLAGREEPSPAAAEPKSYVPWEDRQRLGFLPAFSQTWSESVFRPAEFFRRAPKTGNLGAALLYSCLIGIAGSMLSLFWTYWFWESSPDLERIYQLFGMDYNRALLGYIALLVPIFTIIGIFIAAAIYHLCLMLTGANKYGFETTLRGFCYSYGPQLLAVIPQCGGLIALIWQIILTVIAWREMHESTTGRVVTAALLPLIFCCGLIIIFALGLAGLISRVSY